ncbi:hypothetical protein GCM10025872_12310 [Barrientosiimonas endolithica]|uniref:Uncharacterized protein n=1 Tax=Barrientosiimonas endolithica TaxID=1535208 RepID=A0ABN6YJ93_9MICO|nr:hypothetical protein GCM10025872_12310 [Barrientosiimonas endolithica]
MVQEVAPTLAHAVGSVRDDEVRTLLENFLLPRLAREPISPVAGSLLEGVVEDGSHHGLVDIATRELHTWASANKAVIAGIIGERAPGGRPSGSTTRSSTACTSRS